MTRLLCTILGVALLQFAGLGVAHAETGNVTVPSPPKNLQIPGCGTGLDGERIESQTPELVEWIQPLSPESIPETYRTTRSGSSRVYQSRCQAGRLVSGLRASAAFYSQNCTPLAGGATVISGAAGGFGKILSIALGEVTAFCGVSAYKLNNLADAVNSGTLGCGDLGIAYDATWKVVNGDVQFMELKVANFWCQPGPGDSPPAQRAPTGPFGFNDSRFGQVA